MNRKEMKAKVKEEFRRSQEEKKARRLVLSSMSKEDRKEGIKADKEAKKQKKKDNKILLKSMDRKERRRAKKEQKLFKKMETRTRRYITWGLVGLVLVLLMVGVSPILGDISKLMSIEISSDSPDAIAAREAGEELAEVITDEGIVLIQNNEDLLPLMDKKINVFGYSAINFRIGGGGSGGSDASRAVGFFQGLSNAGITYNPSLYDFYEETNEAGENKTGLMQVASMIVGGKEENEPAIDYLTDQMMSDAKDYSDQALIVLSNTSVEASDASFEELRLSQNQKDLIDRVTREFDHVVLVLNTGNARELGFIEDYPSIKSVVWVGTPGPKGANSLGKVLTGQVNPSGRLVDTYVYDVESHPSTVNFGDYDYTNIDGMSFLEYEEGIYVGYRYYETKYAGDETGYEKAVQFPFGYGLSYTDFTWELVGSQMNEEEILVEVKVTNRGDLAGKDVVQVYFTPPYTVGGIEKSAVELGGYGKTELLEPGESQELTISFATRDMASYDMKDLEAYVLEAGDYEIKVSKNVHDVVESVIYTLDDSIVYTSDEVTGTTIENQFDYAAGDLTYLSRSDFDGTYPSLDDMNFAASEEALAAYHEEPEKGTGQEPKTGVDNGIVITDLKGLDYDDPMWNDFLDQFTLEELNELVNNGAYRTAAVERLGVKASLLLDGPAGLNFFFKALTAASYPTEVLIASTWNDDIAYAYGEAVGKEARELGIHGWYAPAMNVHRSPLGGRNFEYFSEDPLLSGKMSAAVTRGAQDQDVMVFIKHFALNEQEINARSGVLVWANEQAMREIYLRPFEIAVKEGDPHGAMSSFILIGTKWAGGNEDLLQDVLREEWGFDGLVSTDAVLGGFMDLNLAIRNGNELMLSMLPSSNEKYFDELYKEDPVGVVQGARDRVHAICYTLLNHTYLYEE